MRITNSEADIKKCWHLTSVAQIVAAIGAGYNTSRVIVKKGTKTNPKNAVDNEDEKYSIRGVVSQGTFNKKRTLAEDAGLIMAPNKGNTNKRKGETFEYSVNYSKLLSRLPYIIKNKMANIEKRIQVASDYVKKQGNIKKHRLVILERKINELIMKAKQKEHYNIATENIVKKPILTPEIADLEERASSLRYSNAIYVKILTVMTELDRASLNLESASWEFNQKEFDLLSKWLKTQFYMVTLIGEKKVSLDGLLSRLIDEIFTGELHYNLFSDPSSLHDSRMTNIQEELTKQDHPTLFKLVDIKQRQKELFGVF